MLDHLHEARDRASGVDMWGKHDNMNILLNEDQSGCSEDAVQPLQASGIVRPHRRSGGLATWQVKRVVVHVEAHLSERITCAELAGVARLSVGHFSRAFAVSIGHSPHCYILMRRMERAKILMKTTSLLLGQIALECGMADQAHFCRTFRRLVGFVPSIWRQAESFAARRDAAIALVATAVSAQSDLGLLATQQTQVSQRVLSNEQGSATV